MRPPVSPLNVSDSHWIFCHIISRCVLQNKANVKDTPYMPLLFDGLLFSDLLNHYQGRNNYTNSLTN